MLDGAREEEHGPRRVEFEETIDEDPISVPLLAEFRKQAWVKIPPLIVMIDVALLVTDVRCLMAVSEDFVVYLGQHSRRAQRREMVGPEISWTQDRSAEQPVQSLGLADA